MLVNLTRHPITLKSPHGEVDIPPSGTIARAQLNTTQVGAITIDGVQWPLFRTQPVGVEKLPPAQQGTYFIVSSLVRQVLTAMGDKRPDVLSPFGLERRKGRVIGCRGLIVEAKI